MLPPDWLTGQLDKGIQVFLYKVAGEGIYFSLHHLRVREKITFRFFSFSGEIMTNVASWKIMIVVWELMVKWLGNQIFRWMVLKLTIQKSGFSRVWSLWVVYFPEVHAPVHRIKSNHMHLNIFASNSFGAYGYFSHFVHAQSLAIYDMRQSKAFCVLFSPHQACPWV